MSSRSEFIFSESLINRYIYGQQDYFIMWHIISVCANMRALKKKFPILERIILEIPAEFGGIPNTSFSGTVGVNINTLISSVFYMSQNIVKMTSTNIKMCDGGKLLIFFQHSV